MSDERSLWWSVRVVRYDGGGKIIERNNAHKISVKIGKYQYYRRRDRCAEAAGSARTAFARRVMITCLMMMLRALRMFTILSHLRMVVIVMLGGSCRSYARRRRAITRHHACRGKPLQRDRQQHYPNQHGVKNRTHRRRVHQTKKYCRMWCGQFTDDCAAARWRLLPTMAG